MNRRSTLLAALATLAFAASVLAQEVVPPVTPGGDGAPVGPGAASAPRSPASATKTAPKLRGASGGVVTPGEPASPAGEPSLMPEASSSFDKPETGDVPASTEKQAKKSKTEVFEQQLQERIRFRQVRTQALADRAVQAEWERSVAAKTDIVKREALKQYYKLLFARMTKIDGSLKTLIALQATEADHHLTQARISPTEKADTSDEAERSVSAQVYAQ